MEGEARSVEKGKSVLDFARTKGRGKGRGERKRKVAEEKVLWLG